MYGDNMATINYKWIPDDRYTYRLYVGDSPFDQTTLPSTFFEFPYYENSNNFDEIRNVEIDYGDSKYFMFSIEDANGAITYGSLITANAFEDLIAPAHGGKQTLLLNSSLIPSLVIDHSSMPNDVAVRSTIGERSLNTIYSLLHERDTGQLHLYAYDNSNGAVLWSKRNLHQYTSNIITNSNIEPAYLSKHNSYIYICFGNVILMVHKDGRPITLKDGTTVEVGEVFVQPSNSVISIKSFEFSDNGEYLYVNHEKIARFTINRTYSDDNFHKANEQPYVEMTADSFGGQNPNFTNEIAPGLTDDTVVTVIRTGTAGDFSSRLVSLNFDNLTITDVTDTLHPDITGGIPKGYDFIGYKNGRYFIRSYDEVGVGNPWFSYHTIYDKNSDRIIVNKQITTPELEGYFGTIMPLDDGRTCYIGGGQPIPYALIDMVSEEVYNFGVFGSDYVASTNSSKIYDVK